MDSALVWFRRDLRVHDHAALYHALKSARRVYCAFVFDRTILDELLAEGLPADRRVEFIHGSLVALDADLRRHGSALLVRTGDAVDEIVRLAAELQVDAVFANHDYEPYAITRDAAVELALTRADRAWMSFKDQVVFERDEVLTNAGQPFRVFTPYKNAWLKKLTAFHVCAYPVERYAAALAPLEQVSPKQVPGPAPMPTLEELGFCATNLAAVGIQPGSVGAQAVLDDFVGRMGGYAAARDYPALRGPSYLSVHLRFGTVSIRTLARLAWEPEGNPAGTTQNDGACVWLGELIWRDFYHQILFHFPHVVGAAFRPPYDRIVWDDDETLFAAWCAGRTGYPLVDAAMAQLNTTGYMHNRLRMVVASFLAKDLGLDWRRGEHYFARHLNDFDLAANNGGWQWAASTGCDAQPYFRIFNPVAQSEKFDPEGHFIRRYLPQLAGFSSREIHAPWLLAPELQRAAGCMIGTDYPAPVVDHAAARIRTLARYAVVKQTDDSAPTG